MIHDSNPECDTCGERHAARSSAECTEVIVAEIKRLKDNLALADRTLGEQVKKVEKFQALTNEWHNHARNAETSFMEAQTENERLKEHILDLNIAGTSLNEKYSTANAVCEAAAEHPLADHSELINTWRDVQGA